MNRPGDCAWLRPRLDDLLDDALPPDQAGELQRHLGHCLGCQGELRALRSLLDQARALPRERDCGRDPWPQVLVRIRQRRIMRLRAGSFAAAATVALLVGALGAGLGRPKVAGAERPGQELLQRLAEVSSGGMGGGGVGGNGGVVAGNGGGAGQPRPGAPPPSVRSTWR